MSNSVDVVGLVAAAWAAAAAPLPSYYYHYHDPKLYNVDFPIVPFQEATSTQILTLAGVKHIDSNLTQLITATAQDSHKFEIISTHRLDGMQQFKTADAIVHTPAVPLLIMLRDAVHDNNQTAIDYVQSRYPPYENFLQSVGRPLSSRSLFCHTGSTEKSANMHCSAQLDAGLKWERRGWANNPSWPSRGQIPARQSLRQYEDMLLKGTQSTCRPSAGLLDPDARNLCQHQRARAATFPTCDHSILAALQLKHRFDPDL